MSGIRPFFLPLIVLLLSIGGCSNVPTIGKKKHSFAKQPNRIIWIQVAGLADEHIALKKFSLPLAQVQTPLEKALCHGKMWNYNLYNLRVRPELGFQSQMSGSKNVKGSCEDLDKKMIWNYLSSNNFISAVVESPSSKAQSITMYDHCEKQVNNRNNLLWLMGKGSERDKRFHYQETIDLKPATYYDKSCQSGKCFSTLANNAMSLWEKLAQKKSPFLFIIRDFSFYQALKKQDIKKAMEKLGQLMEMYDFFQSRVNNKTLVLLTSSASHLLELPAKGRSWESFKKRGHNILFKRSSLLSSVWASGSGAENFCGFFNESEVLERIMWTPEKNKLGIFEF